MKIPQVFLEKLGDQQPTTLWYFQTWQWNIPVFNRKYMGVSKNRGTPKWMVKIMETPIKHGMIWWFSLIFGNIHIFKGSTFHYYASLPDCNHGMLFPIQALRVQVHLPVMGIRRPQGERRFSAHHQRTNIFPEKKLAGKMLGRCQEKILIGF